MNKQIASTVAALILVGGGSFYGGMQYQQRTAPSNTGRMGGQFANLSPEERQARFQQMGSADGAIRGGMRSTNGGGLVNGEIIAKDEKSITLKLRDGGSKIVFLPENTSVSKSTQASIPDLIVSGQVTVMGTPNTDGSVTAQTIQLRPSNTQP